MSIMTESYRNNKKMADGTTCGRLWRFCASAVAATLLGGCAAEQTPVPQASSMAAHVYEAHCSACHSLPSPKRLYYSQWEHMVGVMDGNMVHEGMKPLTPEDQRIILDYLKANARR